MRRIINQRPGRTGAFFPAALPFLVVIAAYVTSSGIRLEANPNDKLLPALSTIGDAVVRMAFEPDRRTGEVLLWLDTRASLARLAIGLGVASALGLVFGIATGLVPLVRAGLAPFIAALSMIPPLAVLPILFIVFGLGELSKVVLIVIGVAPFIARDVALRVGELPDEQIVKAQTLGASSWQIVIRVVLPQVLPRLIDAIRLSLGPAWLFLIAAEAIAAQEGLGYRIFLVRRYLAMDVILPYVAWITFLAYLGDLALRMIQARRFAWFAAERASR